MRYLCVLIAAIFMSLGISNASFSQSTTTQPVVIELFTSQGCSSCPPADELLKELSRDSSILPLSFHVHYWDTLGWKDPYSSEEYSDRQRVYAHQIGDGTVYTPEAVVNGTYALVGSYRSGLETSIEKARKEAVLVPVLLTWNEAKHVVKVHVGTVASAPEAISANIVALKFKRNATTPVTAGENNGRLLRSVNNVMKIDSLGTWHNQESDFEVPFTVTDDEGIAVIVQANDQGKIIGAGSL